MELDWDNLMQCVAECEYDMWELAYLCQKDTEEGTFHITKEDVAGAAVKYGLALIKLEQHLFNPKHYQ